MRRKEKHASDAVGASASATSDERERLPEQLHESEALCRDILEPAIRDITALKRVEAEHDRLMEQLQESAERYREIFNATSEAISVQDADTHVMLEVNEPMLRMYGFDSKEDLLAHSIGEISSSTPPYTQEEAERLNKLVIQGHPQTFEWQARKKSGEVFDVEVSLSCSRIRGKKRVLAVVRDISERKRAQAERDRMLTAIEHLNEELEEEVRRRTEQLHRMTVLLIGAEEAERERIGHVLHEDLQQILVGLRFELTAALSNASGATPPSILRTVNEAIDVCRSVSKDMLPPIFVQENLCTAVDWLAQSFRDRFGLRVTPQFEDGAEPTSQSIRVFAYRAIRELLLNVVKHAGVCSAALRIAPRDDRWIAISLQDQGKGFDSTQQAPSGLGLFRIREQTIMLGGSFLLQSSSGAGTHVTLVLPKSDA